MNRVSELPPCQPSADWFVGTCVNSTAGETANLLLLLYGGTETRIHGELSLSGGLAGGGPFHADVQAGEVRFTTCLPILQTVVEWKGQRTERGLVGTYQAWCDLPEAVAAGLDRQQGDWSCVRVNPADEAGPNRREDIWVFHDGRSHGPMSEVEFLRHATAACWPAHALAAQENRTSWNTVSGLRDALDARRVVLN